MKVPVICLLAAVAAAWPAWAGGQVRSSTDLDRKHPINPMLAMPDGRQPSPVIARSFARFDANGDGFLSEAEWARYARDPAGVPLDTDGDGRISPSEFQESLLKLRYPREVDCNVTMADVFRIGKVLSANGELTLALERFASQVVESDDSPTGLLGNARYAAAVNGPGAARALLLRTLAVDPTCDEAYLDLAMADAALDREFETALWIGLKRLKKVRAVKVDPQTGYWYDLHVLRTVERVAAFLETRAAQSATAERVRKFAREELPLRFPRPGPPEPSMARAGQLFHLGRFAEAERLVDEFEQRYPGNWRAAVARASMKLAQGSLDDVEPWLARARTQDAPEPLLSCLALGLAGAWDDESELESQISALVGPGAVPWQCDEAAWQLAYQGAFGPALRVLYGSSTAPERGQIDALLMSYCNVKLGSTTFALEFLPQLVATTDPEAWSLRLSAVVALRLWYPTEATRLWEMVCWREPWQGDAWAYVAKMNRLRGQSPLDPFWTTIGMKLASHDSSGWAALAFEWLRSRLETIRSEVVPDVVSTFLTVVSVRVTERIHARVARSLRETAWTALAVGLTIHAQLLHLFVPGFPAPDPATISRLEGGPQPPRRPPPFHPGFIRNREPRGLPRSYMRMN